MLPNFLNLSTIFKEASFKSVQKLKFVISAIEIFRTFKIKFRYVRPKFSYFPNHVNFCGRHLKK